MIVRNGRGWRVDVGRKKLFQDFFCTQDWRIVPSRLRTADV